MLQKSNKISIIVFNNFTNDSRVLKEAKSLGKAGYDVDVIAHLDNDLDKKEENKYFTTKRISYLDRKKDSTIKKGFAYFKFILGAVKLSKKSDFIHCNDLNTLIIGYIVKTYFNKSIKVIYDAHEYETEMNNLTKKTKKIAVFFETWFIKHADKVITVSQSIADEYRRLYPTIKQPEIVLNCPYFTEISEHNDLFRNKFNLNSNTKIFLYQGSLSSGRGIQTIVNAFKKTSNKNIVLVLMGYGSLEDHLRNEAKNEPNIYFHEAVSPNVLLQYTSSADFGISTIENTCLSYYYCLPNKMFEYIMAELPIIVSDLPEMKKVVTEYKIGVIGSKNNEQGILEAIEHASNLDSKTLNTNLNKAKSIFNWENQEKTLLKIYKELNV